MDESPWVIGVILIACGVFSSLYGRRFFPAVISGTISISFLIAVLVFCSFVGAMNTTTGIYVSLSFAFIIGAVGVWIALKYLDFAVAILGFVGGFCCGTLVYTIFLAFNHEGSLFVMILFSFLCALFTGWLSF